MPLYLACVGAALGLEWFLASRESRWPGLALPAVNLLLSILAAVGLASYMRIGDDWIAGSVAAFALCRLPPQKETAAGTGYHGHRRSEIRR